MVIGISIDGVLRDLLSKVEDAHIKYFPPEDGEEIEEGSMVKDYDLDKWLVFPEEEVKQGEMSFDPDFSEDTFMETEESVDIVKTTNKVTLEEFLYEKCTLEIFGYAGETIMSAVETLNQLIIENPQHEFIIISREMGLSIPSTMFFLSKTKCMCQNVKFVKEYTSVWDYVDVMVTDHPNIINSKPTDKTCVVVNKDYNQKVVQSNIRIKTIKEFDSVLLESLHMKNIG